MGMKKEKVKFETNQKKAVQEQKKRATEYIDLKDKLNKYTHYTEKKIDCLNKPFYELAQGKSHSCKAFTKMIMILVGDMNYAQIVQMLQINDSSVPNVPVIKGLKAENSKYESEIKASEDQQKNLQEKIAISTKENNESKQFQNVIKNKMFQQNKKEKFVQKEFKDGSRRIHKQKNGQINKLQSKNEGLVTDLHNKNQDYQNLLTNHTVEHERLKELLWSDEKLRAENSNLSTANATTKKDLQNLEERFQNAHLALANDRETRQDYTREVAKENTNLKHNLKTANKNFKNVKHLFGQYKKNQSKNAI